MAYKQKRKMNYMHTLTVFICLFILMSIFFSFPISSEYISKTIHGDSNTLYVGGDEPGSYSSIKSAIDAARSGDTVFVYQGIYEENIVIAKSIQLIGQHASSTIIDGGGHATVVYISADHVNVSNFTIQNSGTMNADAGVILNANGILLTNLVIQQTNKGISFEYSHQNQVYNVSISNQYSSGITLLESTENRIYETIITQVTNGISIETGSDSNILYANTISHMDIGYYVRSSSYNLIYWNVMTDGTYGIYLENADMNSIITENVISEATYGIYLKDSSDNEIDDGNIIFQTQYGIFLSQSDKNNIGENTVYENTYGLTIDRSDMNNIFWNNIFNNIYGIKIIASTQIDVFLNNIIENYQYGLFLSDASSITIAYNNFIENGIHAYFIEPLFSRNSVKKNYYDDWRGNGAYVLDGELTTFTFLQNWHKRDRKPTDTPYEI